MPEQGFVVVVGFEVGSLYGAQTGLELAVTVLCLPPEFSIIETHTTMKEVIN